MLFCVMCVYCIVLYCFTLYCTVLYLSVFYFSVLHCSKLSQGINPFAVNNNNNNNNNNNFEKWRPLDSSSLSAAGGAILQWTEDIPRYSWDSDDD